VAWLAADLPVVEAVRRLLAVDGRTATAAD
jgi:hypothetical protein